MGQDISPGLVYTWMLLESRCVVDKRVSTTASYRVEVVLVEQLGLLQSNRQSSRRTFAMRMSLALKSARHY